MPNHGVPESLMMAIHFCLQIRLACQQAECFQFFACPPELITVFQQWLHRAACDVKQNNLH